jgi:hypothetical protein
MTPRRRPLLLSLAVAAVLLGTTACFPLPSLGDSDENESAPTQTQPADPTDGADAESDDDPLAERQEFFEAQQLPLDGTPLVAVTPAQKEFISQQRAYVEGQGSTWSAQDENISLALAADACETAILNSHRIDASTLQTHVATSPLFAAILPKDADAATLAAGERNIASVMVFGTSFLCPDDSAAWESAFTEVYGG